jgi:hypothetical protein
MKCFNKLASTLAAVVGLGTVVHSQDATTMHPSFTYANVLPAGFAPPGIGGLDFLGNDGVVCVWGGSQKTLGEVYILPGLATATPGTPVKIDGPLREALGLRVVNGEIFVLTKPELFKYTKQTDGSWKRSSVAKGWAYQDGQWHHFAFSLVHKQGSFYFNTGVAYPPEANEDPQRGSVIEVNPTTGQIKALVKGLRNSNGLSLGPDGELFSTDNEGHWVPTNKVVHIKEGRHYGYRTSKNYTEGTTTVTPPAIWLPYGTYSNSPSRMLLLKAGAYEGQMIGGDVRYGGLQRYFLEKVGGEYQGACFRFAPGTANGIGYGVNELVSGPDGNIYLAGIGGGASAGLTGSDNWAFGGKSHGLGRLTPTTTVPFEIKAMRAVAGGFALEFTAPAAGAVASASSYSVQSWTNTPGADYGQGRDQNKEAAAQPTKVEVSADKKTVTLTINNLRVNRVYYVKVNAAVTQEGGGAIRAAEGWYTLNKMGPAEPPSALRQAQDFSGKLGARILPGAVAIDLPFSHPYSLDLIGLDGSRFASAKGSQPGSLDIRNVPSGIYLLAGRVGSESFSQKVRIP